MTTTPPATRRALPFMGVLLLLEGAVGVSPFVTRGALQLHLAGPAQTPEAWMDACISGYHLAFAAFAALLGLAVLLAARRGAAPVSRFLPLLGFMAFFLAVNSFQVIYLVRYGREVRGWILQFPLYILLALATPAVWGSAIARRDDPGNPRKQRYGRIAAGLLLTALAITSLLQLSSAIMFYLRTRSLTPFGMSGSVYGMLGSLSMLGDRICLLMGGIQSLRDASDENLVRLRARQIDKLMLAVMALTAISMLVHGFSIGKYGPDFWYGVWRALTYVSLSITTALLLAARLASEPSMPVATPAPAP